MDKRIVIKGLLLILFAIILGAFASHYLENKLSPKQINGFRVGANYQLYGGLILLILGFNFKKLQLTSMLPIKLFFSGVCLFSFSLYVLSLFHTSYINYYIWPLTPLGGLLMIISLGIIIIRLMKLRG